MNTPRRSEFLAQVSQHHPEDVIVMVVAGASSHRGKDLVVAENIRLLPLPASSPELNPQEHLWDAMREKEFPNRGFDSLAGVQKPLRSGLTRLARDRNRLRSITAWPWIVTLTWKAT